MNREPWLHRHTSIFSRRTISAFFFLYIFLSLLLSPLESFNHLARVISSFDSSHFIVWLEWRFSARPINPFFPRGSFFTSTANDWLFYEHRFMGFWTYVRRAMNICSFANGHRSYKLAPLFFQYVIDHFFFVVIATPHFDLGQRLRGVDCEATLCTFRSKNLIVPISLYYLRIVNH